MASTFDKKAHWFWTIFFTLNVPDVTRYSLKMTELGNVFGTSNFFYRIVYEHSTSKMFIRSDVTSNEQSYVAVSP